MKYIHLDKNEESILESLDNGEFKSVANLSKEKDRFKKYAKSTLNKTRNINIRLSERDIQKIKSKALEQGIPYQTLASSLIHQFVSKDSVK